MIEDLKKYLINPNDQNQQIIDVLEEKKKRKEWFAGNQIYALRYYLDKRVKIISRVHDGDYQGTYYVILFVDGKYFLWRDSFGSCGGCDALDGCTELQGYNYIVQTMTSVKEFKTLEEIWEYLKNPEDKLYRTSINLIEKLKEGIKRYDYEVLYGDS